MNENFMAAMKTVFHITQTHVNINFRTNDEGTEENFEGYITLRNLRRSKTLSVIKGLSVTNKFTTFF